MSQSRFRTMVACIAIVTPFASVHAQIVEVLAPSVAVNAIDMDAVGPAGPTTLAGINAAAVPNPSNIAIILPANPAASSGVYSSGTGAGRALAIDASGGFILVDPPTGAFEPFAPATIDLPFPCSEFGGSIGDFAGGFIWECFLGGVSVGSAVVNSDGLIHYIQTQGCAFDRVVISGPGPAASWLIGDLVIQDTASPVPTSYETNDPEASHDFDGVIGNACVPARLEVLLGDTITSTLSSLSGVAFECAMTFAPCVPGGTMTTSGGQIINVDLAAHTVWIGGTFAGTPGMPVLQTFAGTRVDSCPVNTLATVCTQCILMTATTPEPFTIAQPTEITVVLCENPQNFENEPEGQNLPFGWTDGGGDFRWDNETRGTPSLATGPTSAFSGSHYLYCETSGPATFGSTYITHTCDFSTAVLTTPRLTFSLSRIGANVGTLEVRQDDGTGSFSILLATYAGPDPDQIQGGTEWSLESIPFTTVNGGGRFSFDYTNGDGSVTPNSWEGDFAIDLVGVQ